MISGIFVNQPSCSLFVFLYRVNEYLKANISHLLVDPDESYIYTKRKKRLLCHDHTSQDLEAGGCDSSSPSGTDTDKDTYLNNVRNAAFPVGGWGTSLSKSPVFTRVELDKDTRNSGKENQNNENFSLPTGLRKAKSFLANECLRVRRSS